MRVVLSIVTLFVLGKCNTRSRCKCNKKCNDRRGRLSVLSACMVVTLSVSWKCNTRLEHKCNKKCNDMRDGWSVGWRWHFSQMKKRNTRSKYKCNKKCNNIRDDVRASFCLSRIMSASRLLHFPFFVSVTRGQSRSVTKSVTRAVVSELLHLLHSKSVTRDRSISVTKSVTRGQSRSVTIGAVGVHGTRRFATVAGACLDRATNNARTRLGHRCILKV